MIASAKEALAFARGEPSQGFGVRVPEEVDVRAIRQALNMSQEAFAMHYGFSVGAVRDWEQHRKRPEAAARILLKLIEKRPEVVEEVLTAA